MKFIKLLSLIAIITCAPALYAMENNIQQQEEQQDRVPTLANLCRPVVIERINPIINQQYAKPNSYEEAVVLLNGINSRFHIGTHDLGNELYDSNDIFQHCINLVVDEIWRRCQNVTGSILDQTFKIINQDILEHIPQELRQLIKDHFCKRKGWHVSHCLKELNNVDWVKFSSCGSWLFIKYDENENHKGELINLEADTVVKYNNIYDIEFSPNGSFMFIIYGGGRGELINIQTNTVIKYDNTYDMEFSPNGSFMFIVTLDDDGELIEIKSKTVITRCSDVDGAEFCADSLFVSVEYKDGSKQLIDVKTGKVAENETLINVEKGSAGIKGGFRNALWVECSANRLWLFVKYCSSRGKLIDAKTRKVIRQFNRVDSARFSSDNSLLFICYENKRELINNMTGEIIKHFYNIKSISLAPDSSLLFVIHKNKRGELLYAGSFEQVIVKYALKNMLEDYKNAVPDDQIKRSIEMLTLLHHPIINTFPHQIQATFSNEIDKVVGSTMRLHKRASSFSTFRSKKRQRIELKK